MKTKNIFQNHNSPIYKKKMCRSDVPEEAGAVDTEGVNRSRLSWKILATPRPASVGFSSFASNLQYNTAANNTSRDGFTILCSNGSRKHIPAFFVSENIVYLLDVPIIPGRDVELVFPLILYKNPVIFSLIETDSESIQFTTLDVASFLYCLDENGVSSRMLNSDGCYIVLDRFIIAMAFIYLVRIGFHYHDFHIHYILAALLIAHKMEEDLCPGTAFMDLFKCSLPAAMTYEEKNRQEKKIVEMHTKIMKDLNFRCLVNKNSCKQIIDKSPNHPLWHRWRLGFHCGAVSRSYHEWKLHCLEKVTAVDRVKSSKYSTTIQSPTSNIVKLIEGSSCCVMCLGNHRSSINLKDRFSNSACQLRHITEICSILKLSASMLSEFVYKGLDRIPSIQALNNDWGLDSTEPIEYLRALSKECVIEEILIRGKRLQERNALRKVNRNSYSDWEV